VSVQENRVYHFADCELDPHEHRLLVHGVQVTLTPKVFDTLVLLVMRAGHAVSKDELTATLWPRGFVHESNLTKHIWTIRRALGGEDETRYIETVPKLGYRFVAPVTREPQLSEAGLGATKDVTIVDAAVVGQRMGLNRLPVDPSTAQDAEWIAPVLEPGKSRWRGRGIAIAASIFVVIAALVGAHLWQTTRSVSAMHAPLDSNAVAITDFSNLSRNAKDAWLGPALTEMLATEIGVSGKLHALPDELVRPARGDLPAPEVGGYAPVSLSTLQRRLGAHYVLSGAYLVSGTGDAPQLRIDLAVQDTRNGAVVATLSRSGPVTDLPRLVAQTGVALRNGFGTGPVAPQELQQVANAQPPTAEVARHIGFALDALHKSDPARARDELLLAIAQAPSYAPAYMYLSQAWSSLGYGAKALAAAQQALVNARGLPQEQRLQIEAQVGIAKNDWTAATQAYQRLVAARPDILEYRLGLVAALHSAGKLKEAQAALGELRKLPLSDRDPRVALAAAHLAGAQGDLKAQLQFGQRALDLAKARDLVGAQADAELVIAAAMNELGNAKQAHPIILQSIKDYRRVDNPRGEANARLTLVTSNSDMQLAREQYQLALQIFQGIGDLQGQARVYGSLSRMLWSYGDHDGAETALSRAMDLLRGVDDKKGQMWMLTGLAEMKSDDSAGDDVVALYRQLIDTETQIGDRRIGLYTLANYGDLLRQRGQLDQARVVCARAMNDAATDVDVAGFVLYTCAHVMLDSGHVAEANATLVRVQNDVAAKQDPSFQGDVEIALGQIAMGQRNWRSAREHLQQALAAFVANEKNGPTPHNVGSTVAQSQLALCTDALGDTAGRDQAEASVRDQRTSITERGEVFVVDLALLQLDARNGKSVEVLAKLRAMIADAQKRDWVARSLEARLVLVQLLERDRDPAANAERASLTLDAKRLGFGWITQRLTMAAARGV